MELTAENFKERLREISSYDREKLNDLDKRLNEKGVEFSIIMPLLDVIMDFNPIMDIDFEMSSIKYTGQRMDYLLCGDFLIEVKRISADISQDYDQIAKYMKNEKIKYAILTNGLDYEFFIKADEEIKGALREKILNESVVNIMGFRIDDIIDIDDFAKIMKLFSKNKYEDTFSNIRDFVKAVCKIGKYGKQKRIGAEDKEIEKFVKSLIENKFVKKKGMYYEKSEYIGKKFVIDCYDSEGYKIAFEVDENGMLIVIAEKCDYHAGKLDSEDKKRLDRLIETWKEGKQNIYTHYKDIIKEIKGLKNRPKKSYDEIIKELR